MASLLTVAVRVRALPTSSSSLHSGELWPAAGRVYQPLHHAAAAISDACGLWTAHHRAQRSSSALGEPRALYTEVFREGRGSRAASILWVHVGILVEFLGVRVPHSKPHVETVAM
jgi:hypothetical protein